MHLFRFYMNPDPTACRSSPLNHFFSLGRPGALLPREELVSRLKNIVGEPGLHSLSIVGTITGMLCKCVVFVTRRAVLFRFRCSCAVPVGTTPKWCTASRV